MTTLLGKLCFLLACTWLGGEKALALRRRRILLEDFCRALGEITREVGFSLRPLAELMEAQGRAHRPSSPFFAGCCRAFRAGGGESWAESWQTALEEIPLALTPEDKTRLREGGSILGRYDGPRQTAALEALLSRLTQAADEAKEREDRLTKVYLALGVTAGLFCCILL
jgi:stage III sporulation protein AB